MSAVGGQPAFDALCLGIMVADVLARPVNRLPRKGTLATVERMEFHPGGCAVNTGITLARLGLRTAVAGKVGQDGFGDLLVQVLQGHGIDTRGVVRDPANNTSGTMVMVDEDGERTFVHYVGANGSIRQADIDLDLVRQARVLHIAGSNLMPGFDGEATARILESARTAGVATSLDTAWDSSGRWLALVEPCLPHLDLFLPSIEEARRIAGREAPQSVADFFLGYGVKTVVLKMGSQGCHVSTRDKSFHLPAFPVQAVDATGAGDAFAGGFLAGFIKGWDLERIARLANAVGALCVTSIGATSGVRSLAETEAFMRGFEP